MLGTKTDLKTESNIMGINNALEHFNINTYFIRIYNQVLKCGVGEGWRRSVGPIM
jgi:hypothetical protein